ncbi:phosphatase PAP2 family protein [Marivirga atlantica]|uniref:Phosphatase PAP2 family protein n=1 Tax=Marivirga atlantica TaxID=1548457 RepID=A0A937AJ43_9BACT|nr:phosphatase PAP2 family protein [Marivirga atlantica]MBL0767123.1 phosphatase PAP2 family protein [Marivirga atlantica]
MRRHQILVCLLLFISSNVNAQIKDTLRRERTISAFILPASLIVGGLYAITDNDILGREEIREERNEHYYNFHVTADDYLQFAPLSLAFLMKTIGIEGRHDWFNSISLLLKSELLMGALVYTGKTLTAVPRPDTGSLNSFPSGHTAQAFMAATYLHKEFGRGRPYVTIVGYTLATSVGVLRVMNDRHWASDVLVGAGIGVLSTNLVYLTHKRKNKLKTSNTLVSPIYVPKGMGIGLTISLK